MSRAIPAPRRRGDPLVRETVPTSQPAVGSWAAANQRRDSAPPKNSSISDREKRKFVGTDDDARWVEDLHRQVVRHAECRGGARLSDRRVSGAGLPPELGGNPGWRHDDRVIDLARGKKQVVVEDAGLEPIAVVGVADPALQEA